MLIMLHSCCLHFTHWIEEIDQQLIVGYYRQISTDSTIQKSSQDLVTFFFPFDLCVNGRLSISLLQLIWWLIHVIGGRYWSSTTHSFAYTSFSSNFQCLPFLDSLSFAMTFVPTSWCFLIHVFIMWDDFVICAKHLGFIMEK